MIYIESVINMNEDLPKWKMNKKAYSAKWKKENTERISLDIPKGKREELQALAERENTSVKGLISSALQEKYGINLDRKKSE